MLSSETLTNYIPYLLSIFAVLMVLASSVSFLPEGKQSAISLFAQRLAATSIISITWLISAGLNGYFWFTTGSKSHLIMGIAFAILGASSDAVKVLLAKKADITSNLFRATTIIISLYAAYSAFNLIINSEITNYVEYEKYQLEKDISKTNELAQLELDTKKQERNLELASKLTEGVDIKSINERLEVMANTTLYKKNGEPAGKLNIVTNDCALNSNGDDYAEAMARRYRSKCDAYSSLMKQKLEYHKTLMDAQKMINKDDDKGENVQYNGDTNLYRGHILPKKPDFLLTIIPKSVYDLPEGEGSGDTKAKLAIIDAKADKMRDFSGTLAAVLAIAVECIVMGSLMIVVGIDRKNGAKWWQKLGTKRYKARYKRETSRLAAQYKAETKQLAERLNELENHVNYFKEREIKEGFLYGMEAIKNVSAKWVSDNLKINDEEQAIVIAHVIRACEPSENAALQRIRDTIKNNLISDYCILKGASRDSVDESDFASYGVSKIKLALKIMHSRSLFVVAKQTGRGQSFIWKSLAELRDDIKIEKKELAKVA